MLQFAVDTLPPLTLANAVEAVNIFALLLRSGEDAQSTLQAPKTNKRAKTTEQRLEH
jgi:hypothetical protein